MAVRNALIVAIFARAALPLLAAAGAMLAAGLVSGWLGRRSESAAPPPKLQLESPFKLSAALKFGRRLRRTSWAGLPSATWAR